MSGLGIYSKHLILLMFLLACPILEEQFLHYAWSCWYSARDAEVTDRLRSQTWVTPGQHNIWQHLTELQVFRKTSTGPLARPAALLVLILQTHQSMPHLGPARHGALFVRLKHWALGISWFLWGYQWFPLVSSLAGAVQDGVDQSIAGLRRSFGRYGWAARLIHCHNLCM